MKWKRIHGFDFCFADFALRSVSVGRWHTLQKTIKNEERTTEKERKTRIWSSDVKEQFRI